MRMGDMLSLKCSILIASAYVSLCLNDFVSAKNYSTSLLNEPRASSGHKFVNAILLFIYHDLLSFRYLARLYLSESFLAMNKIELALTQLDADTVKNESDLSFKMPINTVDKGGRRKCFNCLIVSFFCCLFEEEKSDTPETTPTVPKGM